MDLEKLNMGEVEDLVRHLFPNLYDLCEDFYVGINTIDCVLTKKIPHVDKVSVRQCVSTVGAKMFVIPTHFIIDIETYGLEFDYGKDEFNKFIDHIFDEKQPYIWQLKHQFYFK